MRKFSLYLCILLTALLTVSCERNFIDVERPLDTPMTEEVEQMAVALFLDVPINQPTTRATPAGDYDDGTSTPYENYIDIPNNNFRFMAFTHDNKYIATLTVEEFHELGETPNSKRYQLYGKFEENPGTNFKLAVLANWPSYPDESDLTVGETTLSDIVNSAVFTAQQVFELSATNCIPLFGVKEYTNIAFVNNMRTWLNNIHMLRAMAKVQVTVAAGSTNKNGTPFQLNSLKLVNYREKGLCAPLLTNYVESEYVKGNYKDDYTTLPSLPTGLQQENPAAIQSHEYTFTGNTVTFYVPECDVLDRSVLNDRVAYEESRRTRMVLTFTDDVNRYYNLEFKYYDATCAAKLGAEVGDYFDVLRNNYYKYVITAKGDNEINIVTDVIPYAKVELTPTFGYPLLEDTYDNTEHCCGCWDDILLYKHAQDGSIYQLHSESSEESEELVTVSAAVKFHPAEEITFWGKTLDDLHGYKLTRLRAFLGDRDGFSGRYAPTIWVKIGDDINGTIYEEHPVVKPTWGWNDVTLDNPIILDRNTTYIIGVTYKYVKNKPLSVFAYSTNSETDGFWYKENDSSNWTNISNEGSVWIDGILDGQCLSDHESTRENAHICDNCGADKETHQKTQEP